MLGVVAALCAALGWGASAILARLGLDGVSPALGTLISLVSSFAVTLVVALIVQPEGFAQLSVSTVLWFALIGLVNFPIGRQLNFQAIKRIGPARAAPLFGTSTLFAMLIAVLFTDEEVTVPLVAGSLMVVTGIILVVREQK